MKVGKHLIGEAARVSDLVHLADRPFGIDEVGDPQRVPGPFIVGRSSGLITGTDRSVDVREEPVAELLSVGERLVLFGGVERCTQDDAIGRSELE